MWQSGWQVAHSAIRLVWHFSTTQERTDTMAEPSEPPPSRTLLAAAAGGFGGAILGVVAATTMMGDGDNNTQGANVTTEKPAVEMVATKAPDES